ncbi:MAG TPA: homocysteine S-methyltransferase family protein [Terriglobales bacterium]|nr:homocysteine S-methyltransferase family protein [Terriglobales bacterium]
MRVQIWPCALWSHQWWHQFDTDEWGGELLSLTHREVIIDGHRALLQSGADALVTNTFGATSVVMKDYGAANKVGEVNRVSARLAWEVAREAPAEKQQPLVVGSIGPTCDLLSLHQEEYEATIEPMISAYLDQARALWEGGISIFHVERCSDPLNAKAAFVALTRLEDQIGTSLTKVVTAHVEPEGSMVLGTTVEAFWRVVQAFNPQAFGVVGRLETVEESLASLANVVTVPLIAMVDVFAVASPEGWLQSPKSLSISLARLVNRYKVRIAGVGVEAEPHFILSLRETLRGL